MILRHPLARALAALAVLVTTAPLFAAAQPLPTATPESVGMSGERLSRIATAFQAAVADKEFPGAVVMVARRGKLVYSGAYGRLTPGGPAMTEDAIFRIYSMTKPLVSVAAMMLVEEGRLQITDTVGKFLPGFDEMQVAVPTETWRGPGYRMEPAARAMTVQDLLRHTSGLVYGGLSSNQPVIDAYIEAGVHSETVHGPYRTMPPDEQVAAMAKVPLAHHPGTTWHYSLSADVLGRVIEAVSGQRLSEFLQQRLFGPLKMRDTAFWIPADKRGRQAEPLATDRRSGNPIVLLDMSEPPPNDSGGAGAAATAGDYLRFSQMLLNGGTLDGARILSRTTVNWMASDHLGPDVATPLEPSELLLGTPGYTFGLGFAVRKQQGIAGTPGSKGDYTWGGYAGTYFWVDPTERVTAVLMTQAPGPQRQYFRKLIRQLVYQAIVD